MKIFVVIVAYKGKAWYQTSFDSLRVSNIPLQVVVVDNASPDDTVKYIKTNYPEIILIESEKNLGFGQANNIGIKYALENNADYVFLLNQDAWFINENTLENLIQIAEKYPDYGVLSPLHVNAKQTAVEKLLLNRIADYKTTDAQLINDLFFNAIKDVYSTKYINAAAWLISRKTLDVVGGFDPIFYHYGEDDNYLNRLFFHDLKLGLCPKFQIIHDADRPRKLYEEREEEVLLMIEYTNINIEINFKKEMRVWLKRVFTNILKLRIERSKVCYRRFCFLRENKSNLELSRNTNILKGRSWL